jgi:hypothetical protein
MKQEHQKENPRSQKKKRASNLLYLPILVIVVVGILFYLTSNRQKRLTAAEEAGKKQHGIWESISQTFSEFTDKRKRPEDQPNTRTNNPGPSEQEAKQGKDPNSITAGSQATTLQESGKIQQTLPPHDTEHSTPAETGSVQQSGVLPKAADTSKQAADRIDAFFSHLDAQPYLQSFHLEKPSKIHFTELIENLLNHPPVISRETDDLFTVLKNTAHFYRVIGKDNIALIKTILDQEKPYVEDILAGAYALSQCPSCLQENFSLHFSTDSLYNYAAFFLNTMGGRLYLFRRDSVSRMTVSYYGILIIDKANLESNNRSGIQIKQAIDALIAEIENSGEQLRLKERYLDKLYELKEKYQ